MVPSITDAEALDQAGPLRTILYAIAYRLQTAKRSETKIKRMKLIIDMVARGEKFH